MWKFDRKLFLVREKSEKLYLWVDIFERSAKMKNGQIWKNKKIDTFSNFCFTDHILNGQWNTHKVIHLFAERQLHISQIQVHPKVLWRPPKKKMARASLENGENICKSQG